jgi:hypothetical protein
MIHKKLGEKKQQEKEENGEIALKPIVCRRCDLCPITSVVPPLRHSSPTFSNPP